MRKRRSRLLAVLVLAGAPLAAAAQGFTLTPPSVLGGAAGDALRNMDRLRTVHAQRVVGQGEDLEQTFVLPERPGQNQVSWYEFEWRHYDVPSPSGGQGGIRLYFYGRERAVAERALPVIRNAYLHLVDQFHYTPTRQIPYILYSSQREFQTTNVFQVTESVLGVTSPRDLKMSLPYFGNHELFREVSTHELVHQFHIQKMLDLAGGEEVSSFIEALPLWFTEGIAEYYSKGGLDPEAEVYLRDLVWNPDPERHYEIVAFQEDRFRGYIPTYKLGQARVAFIADVYGKEKIQAYIENAYILGTGAGAGGYGGGGAPPGERGFAALTRRVLNESVEQVDARWRVWLKKRYYPEYMKIRQDLAQLREIQDLPAEAEAFVVSADGNLVFFRGIDREAGRAKLFLMDARYPRGAQEVTSDNQPGVESLHPIEHSVMAIADGQLAFSAQSGAGDVLYVQSYRYQPPSKGKPSVLDLGARRRLDLNHPAGRRFIEISDPSFSQDGSQLAFVGLTETGQLDVYVVSSRGGKVRQLTDDAFAERELAWGKDGITCASDATDHGRFNLFRIDAATGARTRLTTGNWNDGHPRPLSDGSVLYASDASGKPDLYVLKDGATRKITDFATGLSAPASAPLGRGIWAGTFYRGRFRLVEVPRVAWLDEPALAVAPPAGPVLAIPQEEFPDRTPSYSPYSASNWRPEAGIVYGGGASNGVAGRAAVLFSDLLRDHLLYLDLAVYGSFDLTQGVVLFENRAGRTAWVLGAYHFANQQIDVMDPNLQFLERDFGLVGTLRFPIDRFRRFELELSAGAVQRYCLTDFDPSVTPSCGSVQLHRSAVGDWNRRNSGLNPQLGPTFRYGYDTIRYDQYTGPLSGSSLLLELGGNWLPGRNAVNGFARTDLAKYFQIAGRANFSLRVAAGTSFAPNDTGKTWERTWWLTAADNLRGYYPLDLAYLIGQNYYVANAELQFPLDPLIHLAIFDHLEGVAAVDFGGVFNRLRTVAGASVKDLGRAPSEFGAWDARTLTGVLGLNVLFGPLLLRVHFGHPFDIGGIKTPALQDGTSWVTNFTLRYFFF
jgi:hypothetical protein